VCTNHDSDDIFKPVVEETQHCTFCKCPSSDSTFIIGDCKTWSVCVR